MKKHCLFFNSERTLNLSWWGLVFLDIDFWRRQVTILILGFFFFFFCYPLSSPGPLSWGEVRLSLVSVWLRKRAMDDAGVSIEI